MFKILPYKTGSQSARALKLALGGVAIRTENSRYRYRPGHIVINWGNSQVPPSLEGVDILNSPSAVAVAANKLTTLQNLQERDVPAVPFTTDRQEAEEWLREGTQVYARHQLNGHSGAGIEVFKPSATLVLTEGEIAKRALLGNITMQLRGASEDHLADIVTRRTDSIQPQTRAATLPLPIAPLYTAGVSNKGEYRVHVFDGEVILYQKKSRRVGEDGEVVTAEGEEADVRNLASNWIYRTGNLNRLERIEDLAIDAILALGLDFGAVDIIMDNEGDVFVLEVNSAPGLGNTDTLDAYVSVFNEMI